MVPFEILNDEAETPVTASLNVTSTGIGAEFVTLGASDERVAVGDAVSRIIV
jgi:hypothetical protein